MSARGFTLVELLIATVITLLVVAGALVIAGSARSTFLVEPAALDTARRLRDGTDALASALRGAGGALSVAGGLAPHRPGRRAILPVYRSLGPQGGG